MTQDPKAQALASARATFATEAAGLAALGPALEGALGAAFHAALEKIATSGGRVILTGIGKSGHVATKIAATFASTGTPAMYIHPAEASHGDLGMIRDEDVILALSWSGEAPELSDILAYSRRFDVALIALTANAESALGRAADIKLILPKMPEACPNGLAPTTSTVMQMAMGDALAVALLEWRGFTAQDFRRYHPGGKLGARLKKVADLMASGERLPLVADTASLAEAIAEIGAKKYGVTGVVDGTGKLVGIITDGDLRRAMAKGLIDATLDQVMTKSPLTVAPSEIAPEALGVMNTRSISSLFVVEEGRPLGILHLHDLLRAGVM